MKKSAIFGVKKLTHYDIGNITTFVGAALSLVGGVIALAGHCLEYANISEKCVVFPDDEAVMLTDFLFDNCTEEKEES